MSDIAQLGIAVDSRQVTTATAALTGLAAAAKPAGAAVSTLTTAAAPANAALATMAKATTATATAHAGMSTQAMSAFHSIRSMAEGLALGMPPMMVATQQLNHLSYAASGPGGLVGAFKEAGAAFTGLISPTTAIAVGVAAAAAAFVVWGHSVATAEKALGDLSERTGLSLAKINTLQAAAASQGIGSADFNKNMQHFAELSEDAQHNLGPLVELFRANGKAVGDTNTNLNTLSDLLSHVTDTQQRYNILQSLGLSGSRDWMQLLGQGSATLQILQNKMGQISEGEAQALVTRAREFDTAWNTAATNIGTVLKNAFLGAYDVIVRFDSAMTTAKQRAAEIRGAIEPAASFNERFNATQSSPLKPTGYPATNEQFGPATPKSTVDPAVLQKQIALEQQRIGILGQTATVEQQVKAVELAIQAARLNGVSITTQEATNLERLAKERALGIDQIHQNTDSLKVQTAAFGMDAGQAASYTAVQTKINEAMRNGVPLRQDQIALIRQEATALGEATQKLDNMNFASTTLASAAKTFRTEIANGASTWQALRSAALTALTAIEDKLIDMAAKKLVEMAFSSGGTNFLSFLAPAAHSGYGPGDPLLATRAVSPAAFLGAPRFHSGIGPGERPAIIRDDESVLTPGQMKALGGGRNGGAITIAPVINIQGGAPGDDGQARKFAGMIAENVRRVALETIRDQKRPGGILA